MRLLLSVLSLCTVVMKSIGKRFVTKESLALTKRLFETLKGIHEKYRERQLFYESEYTF